jgi:hypothetical protein
MRGTRRSIIQPHWAQDQGIPTVNKARGASGIIGSGIVAHLRDHRVPAGGAKSDAFPESAGGHGAVDKYASRPLPLRDWPNYSGKCPGLVSQQGSDKALAARGIQVF